MALIEALTRELVVRVTGVGPTEAPAMRAQPFGEHGTTLAGLMARYAADRDEFLAYAHDVPMNRLRPDPALRAGIARQTGWRPNRRTRDLAGFLGALTLSQHDARAAGLFMSASPDLAPGSADYSGVAAELYDALRGDDPLGGEFDHYARELAREPGPYLEIGSGTGRILLRLLRAGLDVEGLECSPDMIRLCREKAARASLAPKLYQQRMQEMALPRLYGAIFVPLVTLSLLRDREELSGVLSRMFGHLRPGGRLLFSVCAPPELSARGAWWPIREAPCNGWLVRVSQSSELRLDEEAVVEHFRFETLDYPPRLLGLQSLRLRLWRAPDLTGVLQACGYDEIEVQAGHGETAGRATDPVLVFKARRPR